VSQELTKGVWQVRLPRRLRDQRDSVLGVPRSAIAFFWCAIALSSYRYFQNFVPYDPSTFNSNDWLLNYGGGFVRRGLLGDVLISVHQLVPLFSLTRELQIVQIGMLVLAGILFTQLALSSSHRMATWLYLSPAGLLWSAYSPGGGLRKEIIVIIAILFAATACLSSTRLAIVTMNGVAIALTMVAILSWEAAVVTLPTLLVLQWKSLQTFAANSRKAVIGGTFVLSVSLLGLSILQRGAPGQIREMCSALRQAGVNTVFTCTASGTSYGEFAALTTPLHQQLQAVQDTLPRNLLFVVWLAIGLVPFFVTRWDRRHGWWGALQVLAIAPLFVVATDWGRWIHLIIVLLTVMWVIEPPPAKVRRREPSKLKCRTGLVAWSTAWGFNYYLHPMWIGGFLALINIPGLSDIYRLL
jgi:hypothetical protein